VPEQAHVRVHQIWMGDRAEDAKASTYTARDMMIVERFANFNLLACIHSGSSKPLLLRSPQQCDFPESTPSFR
jgi:hypothetical protein